MSPRGRSNALLWTGFVIVVAGILSGYDESLLKECVAQVLFLASCATAFSRVEPVLGRGRASSSARDLEEGLDWNNTWTSSQQNTVAFIIIAIDGIVVTIDRIEAGPRLLLLGSLAIVVAKYLAPGVPKGFVDELTSRLATTILQAMLWSVGQPTAINLGVPKTNMRLYSLMAMCLPALHPVESELTVILILTVYQIPHWLMVWTMLSSEPHAYMLTKRGTDSGTDWAKTLVGPLSAAALTMLLAILLHVRNNRTCTGGGGDNSASVIPLQGVSNTEGAVIRHPRSETTLGDSEVNVNSLQGGSPSEGRSVVVVSRVSQPTSEEIANSEYPESTENSYPNDPVPSAKPTTVEVNASKCVVGRECSSSSDSAVTPSEMKPSKFELPCPVGPTNMVDDSQCIERFSLDPSGRFQELQSFPEGTEDEAPNDSSPFVELPSSSIPEPESDGANITIPE